MPQLYEPEFKKKIARLRLEGRTIKSLTTEFGISKSSISLWTAEYTKECQNEANTKPDEGKPAELETLEENRRLRKELEEVKKENLFLKKAAAFFAKEID